jgi:hypothetical protein
MIHIGEWNSAANGVLSLDAGWTPADKTFSWCSTNSGGRVSVEMLLDTAGYRRTLSIPDPSTTRFLRLVIPIFGLVSNAASCGAGTMSGSSSNGSQISAEHALLCSISLLPQQSLPGHRNSGNVLDVPSGPPFELLRPPKCIETFV